MSTIVELQLVEAGFLDLNFLQKLDFWKVLLLGYYRHLEDITTIKLFLHPIENANIVERNLLTTYGSLWAHRHGVELWKARVRAAVGPPEYFSTVHKNCVESLVVVSCQRQPYSKVNSEG